MKNVLKLLAVLAVVTFTGAAIAADAAGDAGASVAKTKVGIHGKVTKVDGTKITIETKSGEQVVDTDDNTKFTLDGKPAALSDVKPDEKVLITPETGVATDVKIMSGHGKRGGKSAGTTQPTPSGDAK
ncbi:MAG: hypothetical protein JO353_10300 [Phycisphaerae bacterium]|nr:hypothetical protein [Phycisphaerae bacterium]